METMLAPNFLDARTCADRLVEIDEELVTLHATDEFCDRFLECCGGVCETVFGQRCKRHRAGKCLLPEGMMCAVEFGQRALELRRQIAELDAERSRLRRAWDRFVNQEKGKGGNKQMREDLLSEVLHVKKQRLDLLRERLQLLRHDPVDASAFQERLMALLEEKADLLEFLKLGLHPDRALRHSPGPARAGDGVEAPREGTPTASGRDSAPPGRVSPK
jgi:hypothetical protein